MDPVERLALATRDARFGEHGGVNPSIEVSTTFTGAWQAPASGAGVLSTADPGGLRGAGERSLMAAGKVGRLFGLWAGAEWVAGCVGVTSEAPPPRRPTQPSPCSSRAQSYVVTCRTLFRTPSIQLCLRKLSQAYVTPPTHTLAMLSCVQCLMPRPCQTSSMVSWALTQSKVSSSSRFPLF